MKDYNGFSRMNVLGINHRFFTIVFLLFILFFSLFVGSYSGIMREGATNLSPSLPQQNHPQGIPQGYPKLTQTPLPMKK
jgi:hypothetical protein